MLVDGSDLINQKREAARQLKQGAFGNGSLRNLGAASSNAALHIVLCSDVGRFLADATPNLHQQNEKKAKLCGNQKATAGKGHPQNKATTLSENLGHCLRMCDIL